MINKVKGANTLEFRTAIQILEFMGEEHLDLTAASWFANLVSLVNGGHDMSPGLLRRMLVEGPLDSLMDSDKRAQEISEAIETIRRCGFSIPTEVGERGSRERQVADRLLEILEKEKVSRALAEHIADLFLIYHRDEVDHVIIFNMLIGEE